MEVKWPQSIEGFLIDEVKKRAFLWQPSHEFYYRIDLKTKEWESVAEQIMLHFPNHLCNGSQAKKKFEYLKGAFFRNQKKVVASRRSGAGTDDLYRPKWVWFNPLKFLLTCGQVNESLSNLNTEAEDLETSVVEYLDDDEMDPRSQLQRPSITSSSASILTQHLMQPSTSSSASILSQNLLQPSTFLSQNLLQPSTSTSASILSELRRPSTTNSPSTLQSKERLSSTSSNSSGSPTPLYQKRGVKRAADEMSGLISAVTKMAQTAVPPVVTAAVEKAPAPQQPPDRIQGFMTYLEAILRSMKRDAVEEVEYEILQIIFKNKIQKM